MFDNLNWWEFLALLLVALLIFGDRLPKVISDGLRMVRNLRSMARNATGELGRELGTDLQLEDLHPKAFIRKHVLSEADEEALRKPLRGLYQDIRSDLQSVQSDFQGVQSELKGVADGINGRPVAGGAANKNGASPAAAGSEGKPEPRRFDLDAT